MKKRLIAAGVVMSFSAVVVITFVYWWPELTGHLAGQRCVRNGELVVHYQRLPVPPEFFIGVVEMIEEDYGFAYTSGLSCDPGSWRDRYLSAKDRVVRPHIEKIHGMTVSEIFVKCLQKYSQREYGMSAEEYMETKYREQNNE